MNGIVGGVLFPASLLTSNAFLLLATIVAFNTIIYLGLTLSKLIPLPPQSNPARLRALLSRWGLTFDEEGAMRSIPRPEIVMDDPYEGLRRSVSRRDIPRALILIGGVIMTVTALAFLILGGANVTDYLPEFVAGAAFIFLGLATGRWHLRARTMMWLFAISMTVVVYLMAFQSIARESAIPLAFALVVMTATAPVILAWTPALVSSTLMVAGVVVASWPLAESDTARLLVSAVAALITGLALLQLRLASLDALSDERQRSAAIASTDELTESLTPHGLRSLAPSIASIAERVDMPACVMAFRINDLATAIDQYGRGYGDELIRSVAQSIHAGVRRGDLVSRWSIDEFIVLGLGHTPDAAALATRIQEGIRAAGVTLGKWPATVSVGTASGDVHEATFEGLVDAARANAHHHV